MLVGSPSDGAIFSWCHDRDNPSANSRAEIIPNHVANGLAYASKLSKTRTTLALTNAYIITTASELLLTQ